MLSIFFKRISVTLVLVFIFISCNSNAQKSKKNADESPIVSVTYKHTAGRGGAEIIIATKDTLESSSVGGRFQDVPNFTRKMSTADWKTLTSLIDLKILEKAESGKGRGHYDGPDYIFTIATKDKEYKLINVTDTEASAHLEAIKNHLQNMVSQK